MPAVLCRGRADVDYGTHSPRLGGTVEGLVMCATGSAVPFVPCYNPGMSNVRPHRKQIKHYHDLGGFHELTFSCYRRVPLLTNDAWRQRLSCRVQSACEELSFDLVAFVFMPEHVHLLVFPTQPAPDLSRFLARLKQPFSKEIKQILLDNKSPLLKSLTIRERPGKSCFRYWQEGPGFDRNLFSPEALQASIDYIHNNPVKRGLCRQAVDWKRSSARYFVLEPPKQQFSDLPFVAGVPLGTFDKGQPR
jgi:REP-associated tyrosine transposase